MKRNFICLLLIYCSLFFSCGPSTQEKAAIQQKHDDSIKSATINEVMLKIKEREDSITFSKKQEILIRNAQKIHDDSIKNFIETNFLKKESLVKMQNQYNNLQEILVDDNSKLAVLIDRQKNDAQFHFGRLPNIKEQTLKNDQFEIDNLRINMDNINSQMDKLKTNIKNLSSLISRGYFFLKSTNYLITTGNSPILGNSFWSSADKVDPMALPKQADTSNGLPHSPSS